MGILINLLSIRLIDVKFFDINGINRCSLQTVVQGSKIIVAKNNTCLYEQNSDEEGAYILLKGGIKAKANTMIDIIQLKNALLNEFSIDKTDMLNLPATHHPHNRLNMKAR